ncbi:MAG: roadblock/LC7 domain-containing protein [Firmicutes bacterium]|nr:roadblock/LC7 domain-containing protein [Bacillota bacterium]
MDERDFAELISVFLKGNEPDESPDDKKKKKKDAERGRPKQPNEAEIRKNIVEALAERIKNANAPQNADGKEASSSEAIAAQEIAEESAIIEEVAEKIITAEPVDNTASDLVTQEEVESLLNDEDPLDMVTLQQLLHRFIDIDGVIAAVLVTRDGFTIDHVSSTELDAEMVSAIIATSFSVLDRIGYELNQGGLKTALLEFEHGPVAVSSLNPDVALVIVASQWTTLGRIRWEIKKLGDEIIARL